MENYEEPEPRLRYPVEGQYQYIATAMTNAEIDAIYIPGTPVFIARHIWTAGRMERWEANRRKHGIKSGEGEAHVPVSDSDYNDWLSQQDLVYEADPEKLIGFDSGIDEIISFFSVQKIYVVKGGPADQYIRRTDDANEDGHT